MSEEYKEKEYPIKCWCSCGAMFIIKSLYPVEMDDPEAQKRCPPFCLECKAKQKTIQEPEIRD